MLISREDVSSGFVGIGIGLKPSDIDALIRLLHALRDDPDQHFHISGDCSGGRGVADIEIHHQPIDQGDNATILGFAIDPDGFTG